MACATAACLALVVVIVLDFSLVSAIDLLLLLRRRGYLRGRCFKYMVARAPVLVDFDLVQFAL